MSIPEQYQTAITEFLRTYYEERKFGVEQDFMQTCLPILDDVQLARSPLGQELAIMALAAAGQIDRADAETADEVYECCQSMAERMFAAPGMPAFYDIPNAFWETPIGDIVARAMMWYERDELITLAEAAKLAGVALTTLTNRIERGALRAYTDPDAHERQGRRLVRRSDVQPNA